LVEIVAGVSARQQLPVIDYVTREDAKVVVYRLLADRAVTYGDTNFVEYVLSDSVDIPHPRGTTLTIVVASDKDVNYNDFDKRIAERGGFKGMMPLCPIVELIAMNAGMAPGRLSSDTMFTEEVPAASVVRGRIQILNLRLLRKQCCGTLVPQFNSGIVMPGWLSCLSSLLSLAYPKTSSTTS
jgi:hypothetical protein